MSSLNDEKVLEVLGLAPSRACAAAALFDMAEKKEDDKWFDHKFDKQKMCTEFINTGTLGFIKSWLYSAESNMFCGLIFVTLDQSSNIIPLFR